MKQAPLSRKASVVAWLAGVVGLLVGSASASADAAGAAEASDDWQYAAQLYIWAPTIEGTLPTGDDIEISLSDILDNLDLLFLGVFQARKGKWAIVSDAAYLSLSVNEAGDISVPVGPAEIPTQVDVDVDLSGWVVNLAGAYTVHQADRFNVQLLAGTRYLTLDVEAKLDTSLIPASGREILDDDDDVWDAVVGVRGRAELSDRWWMVYRFDIGAGGSDLTWSAVAQFGRKYSWGSVVGGYRYLHYDFDSDFKLMKELDIYGPVIGAAWEF